MKIFVVNQHADITLGGSEIQCDIIAKNLVKLGHEVNYLVYAKKEAYNLKKENYTYNIGYFSLEPADLVRLIDKYKPDLIYWRLNRRGLIKNLIAAKQQGVKFVFSISHIRDVQKPVLKLQKLTGLASLKKNWRLYRNHTKELRDYNWEVFKKLDGLITLNPQYLDILPVKFQEYIPNSMENTIIPFKWNRNYCVWVANIKKRKNPGLVIELAKRCMDLDMDFIMIGAIQDKDFEWMNERDKLPPNVHYLGLQSPEYVNGVLENSLFLIHTCDPEGFGNNFIQAWFRAKPTITLYFDPNNYITDHKLGFYSKTFDQMVEDVRLLEADTVLRETLGTHAKEFSVMFTPEHNMNKFEAFFLKVLNQ
ncbi:MAG: glycosyltransferase [Mucilaginibacter sp.]